MEWGNDSALRLIAEYRTRELLWNPKHSFYYNSSKKEENWRKISKIMNVPVGELKKKMESLKGSYRREKTRVKKKMKGGIKRDRSYGSKWFAFNSMEFLEERELNRKPEYALEDEVKVKVEVNSEDESTPSETYILGGPEVEMNTCDSTSKITTFVSGKRDLSKTTPAPVKAKFQKKEAEDPRIAEAYRILKNSAPKDECSTYGEHVANKLRKLDKCSRAVAQHKINNVLFEAEMSSYGKSVYPKTHSYNTTHIRTVTSLPESSQVSILPELSSANLDSAASPTTATITEPSDVLEIEFSTSPDHGFH